MGTKTTEAYSEEFRTEIEKVLERRGLKPRDIFEETAARQSRTYGEYRGPAYLFRWSIERKKDSPVRFQLALLRHNGRTLVKMMKTQNMGSAWTVQFATDEEPDTRYFRKISVEGLVGGIPAKRLISRILEVAKNARIQS